VKVGPETHVTGDHVPEDSVLETHVSGDDKFIRHVNVFQSVTGEEPTKTEYTFHMFKKEFTVDMVVGQESGIRGKRTEIVLAFPVTENVNCQIAIKDIKNGTHLDATF